MLADDAPFHPLIYVRGYAMTRGEIDETTVDPFCGFNLGSTVYRATADRSRPPRKFIFESPVVRLASEFGYRDVFEDGHDILDDDWTGPIPRRSIVIYRYYDSASTLLGAGETPDIEEFARGLSRLVLRVRELVCMDPANEVTPENFRCYLVAHSMGGLVCRAFLQNASLDKAKARQYVDKLFTYATPHNGIDLAGLNVPKWLTVNDISNFSRAKMAEYLDLEELYRKTDRVDWLPEKAFPSERVFCLVGTNRTDYETAQGLSRTFAGNGSDGLVRIENATLCGVKANGQMSAPVAKAFVYRAHSGFFGIVNSEEAYQNLIRFLFGDVRVDLWIDIEEIRLPKAVQDEADAGKEVNALYQVDVLASPRGKLWYLTRRVAEEDSVACLSHKEWRAAKGKKPRNALRLERLPGEPRARQHEAAVARLQHDDRRARARLRGRAQALGERALRGRVPLPRLGGDRDGSAPARGPGLEREVRLADRPARRRDERARVAPAEGEGRQDRGADRLRQRHDAGHQGQAPIHRLGVERVAAAPAPGPAGATRRRRTATGCLADRSAASASRIGRPTGRRSSRPRPGTRRCARRSA